jgi:hypothetical protein
MNKKNRRNGYEHPIVEALGIISIFVAIYAAFIIGHALGF